jgi:hypothetical protein
VHTPRSGCVGISGIFGVLHPPLTLQSLIIHAHDYSTALVLQPSTQARRSASEVYASQYANSAVVLTRRGQRRTYRYGNMIESTDKLDINPGNIMLTMNNDTILEYFEKAEAEMPYIQVERSRQLICI